MNKIKLIGIAGAGATALTAFGASAAIVGVPQYSDVVNTTSTAFAQGLVTDLLPWAAAFIAIVIGTLALVAIYKKVVSGFARLFKGGRGRRGRRGRR